MNRLTKLVHLEFLVLNTGFILANTLRNKMAIFWRPALGAHWAVWKPENDENTPNNGYTSQELVNGHKNTKYYEAAI
jgi:hypothetical protein